MRLLLDSQTVLWWVGVDKERLSDRMRLTIDEADDVFVSVASVWELEIKRNLRKLAFADDAWEQVAALGVDWLPIEIGDTLVAAKLPRHHGDPFDRMIVAQALVRGLTLVTSDRRLADYEVPILRV
jgi:PIN domain nuclease of toxin-antitoxin system